MHNRTHADLELRILAQTPAGYPFELTVNHEHEYAGGYLDPGFLPWVATADPTADGQRLFGWLFADAKRKAAWAEVRGRYSQRRVRLRIDADAPELHAIPWELLREELEGEIANDLSATNATPFSRYLAGRWQPGSPILRRPIRVLVAIANPANLAERGLQEINMEEEFAALQAAVEGLDVELIQLPQPCTATAIEVALKDGIHVLHFIGHGAYNAKTQSAALFLADNDNGVQPVTDADFAAMLARQLADTEIHNDNKLRLVYLSSCQTAARSPADAFRGFAPQLVQAGVPAVLAMQDLVPVVTAQAFSTTFYRQLLDHGQVDLAANEARSHLLTAKLPGASIPVLFMRLRDGLLLGKRVQIVHDDDEDFWPSLLSDLRQGTCIPFLGPRVTANLLPDTAEIAERLVRKYSNYPLVDTRDLAKVARFVSLLSPMDLRNDYIQILKNSLFTQLGIKPTKEMRNQFKNANFSEIAAGIGWTEKVLELHENEIHHLLADLKLPLYITTNTDSFMAESLRAKGLAVHRAGPRWEQEQAGRAEYTLKFELSREEPLVFYLNGCDDNPDQINNLVLSEDDYLSHFLRLNRDHTKALPAEVMERLGESSFLFLGYSLNDWAFRVILQGLIAPLNPKKVNVGVQLEEEPGQDEKKVMRYLDNYLRQYKIHISWGTPQQFVTELHTRWQESGSVEEEEWDDDPWNL